MFVVETTLRFSPIEKSNMVEWLQSVNDEDQLLPWMDWVQLAEPRDEVKRPIAQCENVCAVRVRKNQKVSAIRRREILLSSYSSEKRRAQQWTHHFDRLPIQT